MTRDEQADEPIDPPPTIPAECKIYPSNFESDEAADAFSTLLGSYISFISSYIDLERLDGVSVSYAYTAVLAQLDRGYPATKQLTPTTDHAVGVAMAPAVIRDGVVKAHIVFNAENIRCLENDQNEFWKDALYIIAHECGHVHDLKYRDLALPDVILKHKYKDAIEANLTEIRDACWSEYAACRLSGMFYPEATKRYEETFVSFIEGVRSRSNDAIKAYRLDHNHERIFVKIVKEYGDALKYASYLVGHLAGVGATISEAPRAVALLEGHWFAPFLERLTNALDTLWQSFGTWKTIDEFKVLDTIGRDLIAFGGLLMSLTSEGGTRFEIPFSKDTMP